MGHRVYDRGWRDGFYGREPREACPVYLDGWHAGLAKGDRTERPALASTDLYVDRTRRGSLPMIDSVTGDAHDARGMPGQASPFWPRPQSHHG